MSIDLNQFLSVEGLAAVGALVSAFLLYKQNKLGSKQNKLASEQNELMKKQTEIIENQWKNQQPHNNISFGFSTRFWHNHLDDPIVLEIENCGNSRIKVDRAEIIVKSSDEVIRTMKFEEKTLSSGDTISSSFSPKSLPRRAPLLLKIYFFSSIDNFRFQNTRTFDEDLHAM